MRGGPLRSFLSLISIMIFEREVLRVVNSSNLRFLLGVLFDDFEPWFSLLSLGSSYDLFYLTFSMTGPKSSIVVGARVGAKACAWAVFLGYIVLSMLMYFSLLLRSSVTLLSKS
ncbi:Uncharacterized protein Adt_01846 [Abeliophyllum distichum]|uniref:NADH dehydrogenase subunit 6 n=1 Tax=Abeliophyllum distichum TaxID=126358 RepID=A0ABD1VU51_9LAMI